MIVINLITTMALYGLPYSIFIFLYSDYSCLVPPKRLEDLSLVQRDRLAYIDFRLYFFGEIGRPDLIERFGVAPAGATRDLALYREIVPHNITFDGSNKIYRIGQEFSPLFEHASLRILSALSLGFGDGVNGSMQALLPCESPQP